MLSLFVCSLSNIFPRFSRWIPPGILHLCYVIVSRDNDNDGGANYSVEEEDDDMATTEVQTNYVHSQNFSFVATITILK